MMNIEKLLLELQDRLILFKNMKAQFVYEKIPRLKNLTPDVIEGVQFLGNQVSFFNI